MPRRGGSRGLIVKSKRVRQRRGRKTESNRQKELNALARKS